MLIDLIGVDIRAAPDRFLRPPQLRKLRRPQRRFSYREKLVELWWLDGGSTQHAMGLAAVVDVVLEQMQQQAIHPFALDGGVAMHGDDALQASAVERFDNPD